MRYLLWIDDDFHLLKGVQESFQRFGAHVTFTPDICSAVEHLSAATYDAIIVDAGIERGNVDEHFPQLSANLPMDAFAPGLDLIRLLINVGIPDVFPASRIILCSSHPAPTLGRSAPDVLAAVWSIPKLNAFYYPDRFVEEVFHLLDNDPAEEPAAPLEASAATPEPHEHGETVSPTEASLDPMEKEAEWRLHDLRNEIQAQLTPLRRTQERIRSFSGETAEASQSLHRLAEELSGLEGDILDELVDAGYAARKDYERVEEEFQQLKRELRTYQPAKITMIVAVSDQLLDRLILFQRYPSRPVIEKMKMRLNVDVISYDLDVVIDSLVGSIETSMLELSTDSSSTFDTSKVISDLIRVNAAQALNRRVEFRQEVEEKLILSRGTAGSYRRIFSNIIDNAVKFHGQLWRSNAWIEVKHYKRDGNICTEVESWGPSRLEDTSTATVEGRRGEDARRPGQGLGLAIALKEVGLLQGELRTTGRPLSSGKFLNTVLVSIPIRNT